MVGGASMSRPTLSQDSARCSGAKERSLAMIGTKFISGECRGCDKGQRSPGLEWGCDDRRELMNCCVVQRGLIETSWDESAIDWEVEGH